jgi:hypothetical protein
MSNGLSDELLKMGAIQNAKIKNESIDVLKFMHILFCYRENYFNRIVLLIAKTFLHAKFFLIILRKTNLILYVNLSRFTACFRAMR